MANPYVAGAKALGQVVNAAGGYGSFDVNDGLRLRRFLILGSEGGTLYAGEAKLTQENAAAIKRLIDDDKGAAVVDEVPTSPPAHKYLFFSHYSPSSPFFADPCHFARRACTQAVADTLRSRHGLQAG